MLAHDLALSEGQIHYRFHTGGDEYDLRSQLIYIPQRTPKWHGKVKDNLMFTATHYGIAPEQNESYVLMMMIRFGLWEFRNHSWNELSSGYKMRFELARTFLRRPKLLLLDEPLANLDILSQQLILEDLRMLGKSIQFPLGIILSSQQLYEVEKVSDEVVFLKQGKPSSFNSLKEDNTEENLLVIELDIVNSREELLAALEGLAIKELKLLGSNYYIEMQGTQMTEVLLRIAQANIQVNYFRNISTSTRRFFN
jgi:ABC-2 type transport system ATP-binding protein